MRQRGTSQIDSWDGALDLPEQEILAAECESIRPDSPGIHTCFIPRNVGLELTPAARRDMQDIMTFYCKLRAVNYRKVDFMQITWP